VAAVVLILSQVDLPAWQLNLRSLPDLTALGAEPSARPLVLEAGPEMAEALQRAVVPFTTIQETVKSVSQPVVEARPEIQTYTVKAGDTVFAIAAKHNLQPETIQWANPNLESNPDLLRIGDRLVILPTDGVLHVVQSGDTLLSIAARYKVTAEAIVGYPANKLPNLDVPLTLGTQLVIPGGTKPYITPQVVAYDGPIPRSATRGSGDFAWPTSGQITQPFWNGHPAIDIGGRTGNPVKSADSGYVVAARTGWNGGYGNMVMIDHGNGYVTLYGHLNSIFVSQGESVAKGAQIGTVGNTGKSTGPHLHFEVRYEGVQRNPFSFLP
jgi:murein DD-endopeptidase MepM/ murein hydrolase activator NlpD